MERYPDRGLASLQQTHVAEIVHAETLDAAVKRAAASASPGDVVLLAPACASFDQFNNYEHRGRAFKDLVLGIASRANVET